MNTKTSAVFFAVKISRAATYSLLGLREQGYVPSGGQSAVPDLQDAMIYKTFKSAQKMLRHKQQYNYEGEIVTLKCEIM